jgi:hypothetical protein
VGLATRYYFQSERERERERERRESSGGGRSERHYRVGEGV